MLRFWYKAFPQYPYGHKDYWRVQFIFHLMLVITGVFFLTLLLNLFVFQQMHIAVFDMLGLAISLGIYFYFRITGNIQLTAWLATLLLASLNMLFIYLVYGGAHAFIWATLVAPASFFLLGKNWGSVFTVLVMAFCTYVAFDLYQSQVSYSFSFGSVLNVVLAGISLIAIFRFYEGTRSELYQALEHNLQQSKILAETDKLTGLWNREKLDQHLTRALTRNTSLHDLALLIIDIDHFKRINDQQGHLVGDEVLKAFAQLLKDKMRTTDLVARWGGEEFVIVLANTSQQQALELAERLRRDVKQQQIAGVMLTASMGITAYQAGDNSNTMLKRADDALYQAKESGRDQVVAS